MCVSGGCSDYVVSRLMPLLTVTGEDGHVEHYTVDLTRRLVRHCTYVTKHLIREFVVPLDVESPGWSLSGQFIKVVRMIIIIITNKSKRKVDASTATRGNPLILILQVTLLSQRGRAILRVCQ